MSSAGELDMEAYQNMLSEKTRFVACVHISNALGTVNPIEKIIELAHLKSVPVFVDGSQSVAHQPIDLQQMDCDFFAFSGHKVFSPMGIGILYGKKQYLENMNPYQFGGEMIHNVTFEETTFREIPHRFEAGTPNVAGAIGLAKALEFIESVGREQIAEYESELLAYATEQLHLIPNLTIIGTAVKKQSIISFTLENIHPHDIATFLNEE